jgi:hypothetical protein
LDLDALVDLSSTSVPFILVAEAVKQAGWYCSGPDNPVQTITTPHAQAYSAALFVRRVRSYFQCLLFIGELFAKGLTQLSHTQTAGYYEAVLRSATPGAVLTGLKKEQYDDLLPGELPTLSRALALDGGAAHSDCNDSGLESNSSVDAASVSDAHAAVLEEPVAVGDIHLDGGAVGSDDNALASIASDSSDAVSDSSDSSISVDRFANPEPVRYCDNVRFTLDRFQHRTDDHRSHLRYKVICRGCDQGNCERKRGFTNRNIAKHGMLEPLGFLLAWYRIGSRFGTKREHNRANPTDEEVAQAVHDFHHRGL